MPSVSVLAAKKNFSKLLQRVAAGEEIVISNHCYLQSRSSGRALGPGLSSTARLR
jgi:hypothetical protein